MKEYQSQQRGDSPRAGSSASGSARGQTPAARRPFAVFDIDGTLIRWQLYHAVADTLAKRGHIDAKTYEALRNARMRWKTRTHPDAFGEYEKQLVKAHEKALLKLSPQQFEEAAQAVFNEYKDQVYIFTRQLIKDLKRKKFLLFAISGSQIEIVEKIAKYHGFDDCVGTEYLYESGRYSGKNIFHAADKSLVLKKLAQKHNADYAGSVGVGDSARDIPMLQIVEKPIAFNPDRVLLAHTKKKGWNIVIERKNVVYELEAGNGKYLLA